MSIHKGKNTTEHEKEINGLLEQLCKDLVGPQTYRITLRQIEHYLSNCPVAFSSVLPFDDACLEDKIANYIRSSNRYFTKKSSQHGQSLGNKTTFNTSRYNDVMHFQETYAELKASLEPKLLNAISTFLLIMADSNCDGGSKLNGNANGAVESNLLSIKSNNNIYGTDPYRSVISQLSSTTSIKPSKEQSTKQMEPSVTKSFWARHGFFKDSHSTSTPSTTVQVKDSQVSTEPRPHIDANEEVINNAVFVLTGCPGKFLEKDPISGRFKLNSNAQALSIVQGGMLLRLSALGYHRDWLDFYIKEYKNANDVIGLTGSSFLHALEVELTNYYAMIAVLKSNYKIERHADPNIPALRAVNTVTKYKNLTLLKLLAWSVEPLQRLQWLSCLAESCREKKGGQLASVLYKHMQNGSPMVRQLAEALLLKACRPLQNLLITWLLEGEINDLYSEFFIECLPDVGPDCLWNDKYRLRHDMRPSFISEELATKILVAGKSINFLREICGDSQPLKGGSELRKCISEQPEHIFSIVPDTELHSQIDAAYLNTSKQVLDMAMGRYKLLDHLQAMRRYLLLGQGDFIGNLMEQLKSELDKPAVELHSNDLSAAMDAAIRTSNAKYDDPEIINYLDVRLVTPCSGEVGWDILSLQYTVRGPLSTMLEPSMDVYQILFKPLWRMKHLEFVLSSKIWKDQKCNTKSLRPMAVELRSTTHCLHLLTSEMIHFINQIQYYILFEVIECSWAEMQQHVHSAKTLDDILHAHNQFLDAVKNGVFLNKERNQLSQYLETVYDSIIRLEVWQDKFYELCFKELNARNAYKESILQSEKEGTFGVDNVKQFERDQESKVFEHNLDSYNKSLDNIGSDYQKSISCFLLSLNSSDDHNLQLFGIRLDFNEFYKKRDHNLSVPLTFERVRMSSVFQANANKSLNSGRQSIMALH